MLGGLKIFNGLEALNDLDVSLDILGDLDVVNNLNGFDMFISNAYYMLLVLRPMTSFF